jgi:hypothetical protein
MMWWFIPVVFAFVALVGRIASRLWENHVRKHRLDDMVDCAAFWTAIDLGPLFADDMASMVSRFIPSWYHDSSHPIPSDPVAEVDKMFGAWKTNDKRRKLR